MASERMQFSVENTGVGAVSTGRRFGGMWAPSPEQKICPDAIVVVIPAYNEDLVIGSVVLRARKCAEMVIVVDDGSQDDTAEIARLAGAEVLVMPRNGGKAAALMAGFEHAKEYSYAAVVMMDADGQHNPEEIMAVAEPVFAGKADLVIGSRFIDEKAEIPIYRRFGQEILTFFTNASSTYRTTDSQSGFRALSPYAMANLNFSSEGYSI